MKRENAIDLYFSVSKTAEKSVQRLVDWNPSLTLDQNAKRMDVPYGTALVFSKRYGLRMTFERTKRKYKKTLVRENMGRVRELRQMKVTLEEIGRIYGVSKQRIEQLLKTTPRGKGE